MYVLWMILGCLETYSLTVLWKYNFFPSMSVKMDNDVWHRLVW